MAVAEPGAGLGLAVELAVELAVVAWQWRWVELSPGLAPGLAVEVVVGFALGCEPAVELALGCEPTLALAARPLVVVVLRASVMVKKKRHCDGVRVMARVMEFDDAVANVRNHFHCLLICQWLESTPLVLQLRQRLDARLLDSFPSPNTSMIPPSKFV